MKYVNHLLVGLAATGLVLSTLAGSASASTLTYPNVCPSTLGDPSHGTGGAGSTSDCNLLIVFNANGSVTTTGPGGNFESNDDALIGVVNNSGHTITSFTLTNPSIFAFEDDGIDAYVGISPNTSDAANPQNGHTGYGGPLVFYTGVNGALSSGTINIGFGGLASGAGNTNCSPLSPGNNHSVTGGACNSTYFSLEGPADINAPPVIGTVPEPATLTLLGSSLVYGLFRRRKTQA
jgi:hypothetical protein